MLEGVKQTVYGNNAANAVRLATVGGALILGGAAETALTVASVQEFGYLTYLRADCTVVSTTGGTWTLRNSMAGAVLLILAMPLTAAPVGTSYCWPFPVPWKNRTINSVFTLQPSIATMGTWHFICNGFLSSI